jgi:peptidoglycan DL-endopeptidase CwlO
VALTRGLRSIRVVLGVALLAGGLLIVPFGAGAVPSPQQPGVSATPTTSAQVQAKLAELAKTNGQLTEQFNQAQIDVVSAQRAAESATRAAAAAQAALIVARHALASSLLAQYKGSTFSRTAALLGSDSGQNYLEKMQSLSFLAMHQKEVAVAAGEATAAAARADQEANALVSTARAKKAAVAKQRATLSAEIAKQEALLAKLTATERAKLLAATAAPKAQVAEIQATPVAAKSKGAAVAIQAALTQLGKPYSWGAAGPGAYDCSGLTMWSWAHAGVSLPHQSAEQQALGTPVSQSDLQPGDLVFFGSPAYHVGLYLGNGMMVHAPTTGDVVKISSVAMTGDYSGAVRVG